VRGALVAGVLLGLPVLAFAAPQTQLGPAVPSPSAERPDTPAAPEGPAIAPVPFGPGERAVFQARWKGMAVGSGSLTVHSVETVDGRPTYRTQMRISGGVPMARVDNRMESWIDVRSLFSRRFHQDTNEVRFKRRRTFDFFPERRQLRWVERNEIHPLPTSEPLDDLSFLYFARTLPLRVGDTYTLNRYWKTDGNPVVLRVLRRDTVEVPAGTFSTIVVQPIIRTDGLFSQGGEAEVHFTDDARRIPVMLRSRVPVMGELTLRLREYHAGERLTRLP
jgi:hypothetical protein